MLQVRCRQVNVAVDSENFYIGPAGYRLCTAALPAGRSHRRHPAPPRPPKRTVIRLCSYIDHADDLDSQRMSTFNRQEILDALSPGLRQEVVLFTNAALLSRLPSLARQTPEVQAFVVERLRRRIVSENATAGTILDIPPSVRVPRHADPVTTA